LRQGNRSFGERFDNKGACRYAQNSCGRTLRCTIQICENSKVRSNRPESARGLPPIRWGIQRLQSGDIMPIEGVEELVNNRAGALNHRPADRKTTRGNCSSRGPLSQRQKDIRYQFIDGRLIRIIVEIMEYWEGLPVRELSLRAIHPRHTEWLLQGPYIGFRSAVGTHYSPAGNRRNSERLRSTG